MQALDDKYIEVGKAALSNLFGGIGYFFGRSRIAVPSDFQVNIANMLCSKIQSILISH